MSKSPPNTSSAKKRECFVISPIGEDGSKEREIADQLYDFILKPVVEDKGYTIDRADKIHELGQIPTQIVQRIFTCDLVIADLTGYNPNVFYELAIRHFTQKPVIQVIRKGEKIPFDNSQTRTVYYDVGLKSGDEAKKQLKRLLESPLDEETENPISAALVSLKFKNSNDPDKQMKAEIFDKLQSLDNRLGMIQNQIVRQTSKSPSHPNYDLFTYNDPTSTDDLRENVGKLRKIEKDLIIHYIVDPDAKDKNKDNEKDKK